MYIRYPFRRNLFRANPSLLLIVIYVFILSFVAFVERDKFPFDKFDLFTAVWTYPLVLMIHTVMDIPRIRKIGIRNWSSGEYYTRITKAYLPYLLIAVIYENLVLFRDTFADRIPLIDQALMTFDEKMLGLQPAFLMEKLIHPWAVEFFMLAYGLFFIYPYAYLIYLLRKDQLQIFDRVMLAQMIALVISLTSFIIFPAQGPRYFIPVNPDGHEQGIQTYTRQLEGIQSETLFRLTGYSSFYRMQYDLQNQLERIKTDCMPSMHTCLCLICLFYALQSRQLFKWRKTAVTFWVGGVTALIISTVYLRYHWVIDMLIGAALAVIVYYLTEWLYAYWVSSREQIGISPADRVVLDVE